MADEEKPVVAGTPPSADKRPVTKMWLEVSNVKIAGETFEVQLRADREPERPRWWEVDNVPQSPDRFKAVIEALDKKRPVMAKLVADAGGLKVTEISIQYAETTAVR